jgi:hypothetical protein
MLDLIGKKLWLADSQNILWAFCIEGSKSKEKKVGGFLSV